MDAKDKAKLAKELLQKTSDISLNLSDLYNIINKAVTPSTSNIIEELANEVSIFEGVSTGDNPIGPWFTTEKSIASTPNSKTASPNIKKFAKAMKVLSVISCISGVASAAISIWEANQEQDSDKILNAINELSNKIDALGDRLEQKISELRTDILQQLDFIGYDDAITRISHGEHIINLTNDYSQYFSYLDCRMACDNIIKEIYLNGVDMNPSLSQNANALEALSTWTQAINIIIPENLTSATQSVVNSNTKALSLVLPFNEGDNTLLLKVSNAGGPAGFIASFRGIRVNGLEKIPSLIYTGPQSISTYTPGIGGAIGTTTTTKVWNWSVANASPGQTYSDTSSLQWNTPTDKGQYGVEPWNKNVFGFPEDSAAHWIWEDKLSDNQELWFKCEFKYNRDVLVTKARQNFTELSNLNIIDYNIDDLSDDLFRLVVNALTDKNPLRKGTFEFVYETSKGRPSMIFEVGNKIMSILLRGYRVLSYMKQKKALNAYLASQNVSNYESLTTQDQKNKYQQISDITLQSVSNLIANPYNLQNNLMYQLSVGIITQVEKCADKTNFINNVTNEIKSFCTSNLNTYTNNQELTDALLNNLKYKYNNQTELNAGLPDLNWLVIAWDSSTSDEILSTDKFVNSGTQMYFVIQTALATKNIIVIAKLRSSLCLSSQVSDEVSNDVINNVNGIGNNFDIPIVSLQSVILSKIPSNYPAFLILSNGYFSDSGCNLYFSTNNTALVKNGEYASKTAVFTGGRVVRRSYLLFG